MTQSNKIVHPVPGMGSRRESYSFGNISDSWAKAGTNGRRLKNALEVLERDPKRALQETERLIKKHGSSPPFSACKALSSWHHDPQSIKVQRVCYDLVASIPVTAELDEMTILCVIHFYQHQAMDYAALHNFLQKLVPVFKGNADILDLIWLTYFRHHNAKEMQKAVMELSKVDVPNSDRHFIFGVMGLVMQGLDSMDTAKRRILLTVAYRTLDKRFPPARCRSNEAVLKLWLLIETGDIDGCLPLLEGFKRGSSYTEETACDGHDALVMEVCRLLAAAGRLDEAESNLLEMIKNGNLVGDFVDVLADILAQRFLASVSEEPSAGKASSKVTAVLEMLDASLPPHSINVSVMARLQFFRRLSSLRIHENAAVVDVIQTGLLASITEYFEIAGDRPSFYSDVEGYLLLLAASGKKELLNRLSVSDAMATLTISNDQQRQFSTVSQVIRHQNMAILRFALRNVSGIDAPSSGDLPSKVNELLALRRYVTDADGLGKLQSPDMVKLGDVYAALAVFTLFDEFQKNQNWTTLLNAVILLESTMTKDKPFCNPSLRILLTHLYLRCGAVAPAYDHFTKMDIKSLQVNHLSFLVTSALLVSGMPETSMLLLDNMVRFYNGALFELFDAQLQCVSRDRDNYYRIVELELLKRDQKFCISTVYANYARLWSLPARNIVTDWEARSWTSDTDRFLGQNPSTSFRTFSDRNVVPSWDTVFDEQQGSREAQLHTQELSWLSVLKSQMELYAESFSLAMSYARYNPFDSASFSDQMRDVLPSHRTDLITRGGEESLKISCDAFFNTCKDAGESLAIGWRTNQQEDVSHLTSTSFPHSLPFYLTMGCHALLLRIAQLAQLVDRVLSSAIKDAGGIPSSTVPEVVTPTSVDDKNCASQENGTAKKPFGIMLSSLEISLKLQQMIHDVFANFDGGSDSAGVYRYRDMIIKISLLAQVFRSALWIIQCVRDSLITLSANNDKRKDSKSAEVSKKCVEFRRLMEEWYLGFALFLEDLQNPVHALAEKLHVEAEKLSDPTFACTFFGDGTLGSYAQFPLCADEPSPEVVETKVVIRTKQAICDGWRTSLTELSGLFNESGRLLAEFSTDARSKIKTKGGKPGPVL
ncbi:hypothetical protein BV898_04299 [Hypsibius exemplaris]|uniref:Uncharacterized protein n=1 Tax=Hypsibius exemplaris TaxID=2072580 RepID=A0A1W0X2V1_HYPEX|nr:hypothetical protein BV898_04299 [Hypsibius exemplaris]